MLSTLRSWCGTGAGRRRLAVCCLASVTVGWGLVLVVGWVFGTQVLGTMVRAFFTAASSN